MEPPSPSPPPPPSEDTSCTFEQCFCSWRRSCSPRIPSVAPGRDYENMLAGADNSASWSLLVGYILLSPGNNLVRLHRFRVARSGRVLGRSGDALEIFDDVDYNAKDASSHISCVTATPSPDGRSLCLFCKETRLADLDHIVPPRPLQLHLNLGADDRRITVYPLPVLPPELKPVMPTRPISAAGDLWAPYLTKHYGPSRLVMLRLDKAAGLWVEVAAIDLSQKRRLPGMFAGRVLQGYAVVGRTILLSLLPSLQPDHLFFAFDCTTHNLAAVVTTVAQSPYIPIHGRGVYVEEDDTIYFLSGSFVCAYKLCQEQDQYRMALPTKVDCLWPFREEGYGFLTYLGSRVMCAVWIGTSFHCNCNTFHVVITTFQVNGNNGSSHETFVPQQVKILHCTCRQLDMSPSKLNDSLSEFCFLQEFEEFDHASAILPQKRLKLHAGAPSMLHQGADVGSSSNVVTWACCRKILNEIAYSPSVMLDDSAIKIYKAPYIICQDGSCSTVYKITILDGRLSCQGKTLIPYCTMETFISDDVYDMMKNPLPWHFVCGSENIYAVPSEESKIFLCSLHSGTLRTVPTRRDYHSIVLVLHLGSTVIAISDSLKYVYVLSHPETWVRLRCSTNGPFDLERKVNLSGYVVISEDSFIVCDSHSGGFSLFDLRTATWTPVYSSYCCGLLTGRSVYVEGFIYTCTDGGLAAYEIIGQGGSYYLGDEIDLPFSWRIFWESHRMCVEYVGKDTTTGAVMFCVVQGGDYGRRCGSPDNHPICITTVQIKTERTHEGKLKPLIVGHVDIGTSFIERKSRNIWTSFCFLPLGKKGRLPEESSHSNTQTDPQARCSVSSVHQPTLKIFCKANKGYCLAIHDGTLVLAPSDSCDEHQHWFRDTRLSTSVKDEEGNPVFSLINKATSLAIKHSLGPYHPVRLVKFNPDNYDESLLWTESCDLGKDFGCIRMMHDISLGLDALHRGGGMRVSSTSIVLSEWAKSDTQSWKIVYWDDEANVTCGGLYTKPYCRIYSKADKGLSVAICNGAVCLVPTNPADKYQHWIKDTRYQNRIKDKEGYSGFALINAFTGMAIKCSGKDHSSSGKDHSVELVPYNPNYLDKSVLWTESCDVEHGYQCIRVLDNVKLSFHAFLRDKDHDSNVIVLRPQHECDNQRWKIVHWGKSQPKQ